MLFSKSDEQLQYIFVSSSDLDSSSTSAIIPSAPVKASSISPFWRSWVSSDIIEFIWSCFETSKASLASSSDSSTFSSTSSLFSSTSSTTSFVFVFSSSSITEFIAFNVSIPSSNSLCLSWAKIYRFCISCSKSPVRLALIILIFSSIIFTPTLSHNIFIYNINTIIT